MAIVVGFCFGLIFFFVPETFWDRTPRPHERTSTRTRSRSPGKHHHHLHLPSLQKHARKSNLALEDGDHGIATPTSPQSPLSPSGIPRRHKTARVGFAIDRERDLSHPQHPATSPTSFATPGSTTSRHDYFTLDHSVDASQGNHASSNTAGITATNTSVLPENANTHVDLEKQTVPTSDSETLASGASQDHVDPDKLSEDQLSIQYTDYYREAPPKSYVQTLKPWNGRLAKDKWIRVMVRPFILFAYPAVLWSSLVYALAVGWLIVLSESVAHIYQNRESYNFTSLQVGLVYIAPFVGGVLGTAVAGKISDIVVRYMARKNDGVYEPEFRLIMAIPIALSTTIGLMGFGWSAEEKDNWIVPTIFFGVISFGCSLASTTAVTFVVDSYRVYAGEALVTLNVSKSIVLPSPVYEYSMLTVI